ncbi:acyltransferase [Chryseobacterium suipulveris]|uniref:Acyltransferase n=1 Tax=Chryseobacterium suipulveris TaxID=2929800 RepID=A0ABY4BQP7_9FLAO|nr:acyltransferase [Chryseobacterium suipulveris]UOE41528.1 acyltransferase [Chryseobacterium suipulveris]
MISHINNRLPNFNLEKGPLIVAADYAVTVFFTLSGFLITYLLLAELKEKQFIDVKKFYIRRILRIWPLYFLYLVLTMAIIGFDQLRWPILLYIFMIPNFRNSIAQYFSGLVSKIPGHNFLVGHYWSLGVEEQFYAFWPWIVRKTKYLLPFLLIFPVTYVALKILLHFIDAPKSILVFVNYTRFGCMVIGALGAYLYFHKKEWITDLLNRKVFEILAVLFFVLVLFNKFHIASPINHEIASAFTLLIIINQITNSKKLFSLENRILNFLGKISYGLYVWNPLLIYLVSLIYQNYFLDIKMNTVLLVILVFMINTAVIIAVSYVSYEYFEKRFLRIKHKYTTVKSSATKEEYNEKA